MAIFSNQATLTYNGNSTSSNIVYGELLEVLTATKTAVEGTYLPGELVTYVVTLRNTGSTTEVTVDLEGRVGIKEVGVSTTILTRLGRRGLNLVGDELIGAVTIQQTGPAADLPTHRPTCRGIASVTQGVDHRFEILRIGIYLIERI